MEELVASLESRTSLVQNLYRKRPSKIFMTPKGAHDIHNFLLCIYLKLYLHIPSIQNLQFPVVLC